MPTLTGGVGVGFFQPPLTRAEKILEGPQSKELVEPIRRKFDPPRREEKPSGKAMGLPLGGGG
jgi:hypothetical protein